MRVVLRRCASELVSLWQPIQSSLQTAELAHACKQGCAVAVEAAGSPYCLTRTLSLPQLQNPLHPIPAFDDTPPVI